MSDRLFAGGSAPHATQSISTGSHVKIAPYLCLLGLALPLSPRAAEVHKSAWIDTMTTALPTAFCNPSQYFRQCFRVTAQECEQTASSATRICLDKHKDRIPNILNQPADGTRWGTVVGSCAGEAYEITLSKKRIKNKKCDDPANWQ
jgi:hypothetical protein